MRKIHLSFLAVAALSASCGTKTDGSAATASKDKGKKSTISTSAMDKSVRPQDDFFQFSNGTWCKENPVPPSESRWGSFNELEDANKKTLTEILKKAEAQHAPPGSQDQLLGEFYASFMNMEVRNTLGTKPVNTRVRELERITSRESLPSFIASKHITGIPLFFSFGIDQDLKDVNNYMPYLGQTGLGLPNRDYYFDQDKEAIRGDYKKYITSVFTLLNPADNAATQKADMVLAFETKMAEKMMAPAEMRNIEKQYNKMSLADAKKLCPDFNLEQYLSSAGSQSFDTIIVAQPDYIVRMNELYANESMESIRAYMEWTITNHYIGMTDEKGEMLQFEFYGTKLTGKKELKPRNDRAIDELTGNPLSELLGKAFVERSFSPEAQARVNELVDNLLLSFRDRINGLDWMSNPTKDEALIKLNAIGRKLGFPEQWKDFSGLTIKRDDYIGNIDVTSTYSWKENMAKLNKPVDKKEWGMPAHMVNAYYNPLLNEIAFPAGIMQPPFFDVNAEDAVNYGRIGMVIGHEFTHGFDDMGSQFAANGNFSNWWQESDRTMFEERTKTLGATFSGFCPTPENCVNPELTMGENIADLGGLTMAYYAYTRTEEFKKGELRNGYTPAQRFFIAYAQLWKINYTPEEMKNRLENDSHSPGMYRVNGPLKNCPEFFEAFGIKEGEPMRNGEKQVAKIW